jgi:hypothetical protein
MKHLYFLVLSCQLTNLYSRCLSLKTLLQLITEYQNSIFNKYKIVCLYGCNAGLEIEKKTWPANLLCSWQDLKVLVYHLYFLTCHFWNFSKKRCTFDTQEEIQGWKVWSPFQKAKLGSYCWKMEIQQMSDGVQMHEWTFTRIPT